jgi:RNA polymerase-binding transcription factor DksA
LAKSKKADKKTARSAKSSSKSKSSSKARPKKPSPAKAHTNSRPVAKGGAKTDKKAAPKAAPKDAKKAAKLAPAPQPIVLPPIRKVEAPAKFRREYRRWKDVLISLRHRLLKEGSNLEEEGLKALEQEVSVDHMADFGSDSSEQETTLQLIESNSLSLRDVDDALKRIDAKSYGLCEECEALIPAARLGILPHARFCIECQSRREGMPA